MSIEEKVMNLEETKIERRIKNDFIKTVDQRKNQRRNNYKREILKKN